MNLIISRAAEVGSAAEVGTHMAKMATVVCGYLAILWQPTKKKKTVRGEGELCHCPLDPFSRFQHHCLRRHSGTSQRVYGWTWPVSDLLSRNEWPGRPKVTRTLTGTTSQPGPQPANLLITTLVKVMQKYSRLHHSVLYLWLHVHSSPCAQPLIPFVPWPSCQVSGMVSGRWQRCGKETWRKCGRCTWEGRRCSPGRSPSHRHKWTSVCAQERLDVQTERNGVQITTDVDSGWEDKGVCTFICWEI